jgi:hypothetical protein
MDVITIAHPHGKVINLDLELAAEVLAIGTLLAIAPVIKWQPLGTLCDNTPAVSCIKKMASKSISPTAGRLLRGLAFLLHSHQSGRLTTVHVPGKDNIMADIASRPSKALELFRCHTPMLSDFDFTLAFDRVSPLPTQQRWRLAMVPIWLKSNVFETLRGKQLDQRRWTAPSGPATGKRGSSTAISTPTTIAGTANPQQTITIYSSPLLLPCGKVGLGRQVKVHSVAVELHSVAQKYVLDGHPDPRRASPAQHSLDLPIARILKRFDDEDPAPEPKLAIPVSTITAIATKYNFTTHHAAVSDMVIVAFFYLLLVGEYTSPSNTRPRRTIPLRKCDIRLWHKGTILDHAAPLSTLLRADSATISIANTKNGTKGAFVHHYAIQGAICPVAALG